MRAIIAFVRINFLNYESIRYPNLWVPLALLSLIVIAAVFFSRSS
jgi:hypothetical protein